MCITDKESCLVQKLASLHLTISHFFRKSKSHAADSERIIFLIPSKSRQASLPVDGVCSLVTKIAQMSTLTPVWDFGCEKRSSARLIINQYLFDNWLFLLTV